MSSRSKVWLRVAGIISIITCILFVTISILVLFNIAGLGDYYADLFKSLIRTISPGDLTFYKITIVINFALSMIINIVACISYFKISSKQYLSVSDYFTLSTMGAIQLLFGLSILPGIIALVISVRNRHIYTTSTTSQPDDINYKIKNLNKLHDAGQISNDEYHKSINKYLDEYVQSNNKEIE